jgi:hypothetical protein
MTITMQQAITPSIEELKQFVSGSESVKFKVTAKTDAYQWLQSVLIALGYVQLSKADKGIDKSYAQLVTGYSRATIARLIAQYVKSGHIRL